MVSINVSDLEGAEVALEDLIQRISTNIALLEKCNKDWTMLLNELKGEEHIKEKRSICGRLTVTMELSNLYWILTKHLHIFKGV